MVEYKGNKIRAERVEILIALDDDGNIIPSDGVIHFGNVRCLGGTDGKLQVGYTRIVQHHLSNEVLYLLDNVLSQIYEDRDHLKQLQNMDKLSGEPIVVNGTPFNPIDEEPVEEQPQSNVEE